MQMLVLMRTQNNKVCYFLYKITKSYLAGIIYLLEVHSNNSTKSNGLDEITI